MIRPTAIPVPALPCHLGPNTHCDTTPNPTRHHPGKSGFGVTLSPRMQLFSPLPLPAQSVSLLP